MATTVASAAGAGAAGGFCANAAGVARHTRTSARRAALRELDIVSNTEHPTDATLEEVTAALRTAARTALAEVDAALGRMEIGEYGICQDCGADIALARLEIVPMTARCMPCQRLNEAGAPDADAEPA